MEDDEEAHKGTYSGSEIPKLLLIYAKSRSEHRRCHRALSSHGDGPSLSVCESRWSYEGKVKSEVRVRWIQVIAWDIGC